MESIWTFAATARHTVVAKLRALLFWKEAWLKPLKWMKEA